LLLLLFCGGGGGCCGYCDLVVFVVVVVVASFLGGGVGRAFGFWISFFAQSDESLFNPIVIIITRSPKTKTRKVNTTVLFRRPRIPKVRKGTRLLG
jgi:hypothetical protein